jgi:hypothetical protein
MLTLKDIGVFDTLTGVFGEFDRVKREQGALKEPSASTSANIKKH